MRAGGDFGAGRVAVLHFVRQLIDAGVVWSRFDQEHRTPGNLAEASGDDSAGRSCSENDVVVLHDAMLRISMSRLQLARSLTIARVRPSTSGPAHLPEI